MKSLLISFAYGCVTTAVWWAVTTWLPPDWIPILTRPLIVVFVVASVGYWQGRIDARRMAA